MLTTLIKRENTFIKFGMKEIIARMGAIRKYKNITNNSRLVNLLDDFIKMQLKNIVIRILIQQRKLKYSEI